MSATALATANGNDRTIATAQLARSLSRSVVWVEQLLGESATMGLVESAPGGWRLSDQGERRFGQAFRNLSLPGDGLA